MTASDTPPSDDGNIIGAAVLHGADESVDATRTRHDDSRLRLRSLLHLIFYLLQIETTDTTREEFASLSLELPT